MWYISAIMLKYFAMLTLLLPLTMNAISAQDKKTNDQPVAKQCDEKCPGTIISVDNRYSGNQCKESQEGPEGWRKVMTFPEGVTAWALILTFFAIAIQAVIMQKHAGHLKTLSESAADNAKAARSNAQAIINSERPWVVIKIDRDGRLPNFFRVRAENRGRTPAAILSAREGCAEVTETAELQMSPAYSKVKQFKEPLLLMSGESQGISDLSPDHVKSGYFPDFADWEKIGYIFGSVVYRDLLDTPDAPEHETRWCCKLDPDLSGEIDADDLYLIQGPERYTRHT